MRVLFTAICAFCVAISNAQAQDELEHPVLGAKSPNEILNSDLMRLPDRERQAWVHGVLTSMVYTLRIAENLNARCVNEWYFETGKGKVEVAFMIKAKPDAIAFGTVVALARDACPQLLK